MGPPEEKVRESLKISAIWPLSKPASNNSRSAEVSRWVPGCMWSRLKAGSVVRRTWPSFLSLVRAEVHMCFVPDRYPGVSVEAAGRERRHPIFPPLGFGRPEGRAVCAFGQGPSTIKEDGGRGGSWA